MHYQAVNLHSMERVKSHLSNSQHSQLHLQSGEQGRLDLTHVQFKQFPLQQHFTNSRQAFETSGMVI